MAEGSPGSPEINSSTKEKPIGGKKKPESIKLTYDVNEIIKDLKQRTQELDDQLNKTDNEEDKEKLKSVMTEIKLSLLDYATAASKARTDVPDTIDIDEQDRWMKDAMREKPPDIREKGISEFLRYFDERLYDLIEKQKERSFDEDRHLVYPLEMAIRSLWPKDKKGDIDKITGKNINYDEIRQRLTDKLAAFRSCHNAIYIYQNVDQAASLIKVAQFFKENVEEELSKYDEIGKAYRKIISILEDDSHEKEERQTEIKKLIDEKGADNEIPLWAFRMASGLVCIHNEAAKVDFQFHQSGDFFQNRLFNLGNRAAKQWAVLGREPSPELCQSLDLRLKTLWQRRIESKLEKLVEDHIKNDQEIKTLNKSIKDETDPKKKAELEDKKKEKEKEIRRRDEALILKNLTDGFKKYGIDLTGLKFEDKDKSNKISLEKYSLKEINLKKIHENDFFELKENPDNIRQQYLDLADADGVRKIIFDPTGFLDIPDPMALISIEKVMKHLKGKERASWFRDVCIELVDLYQGEKNWITGNVVNKAKKFLEDAPILGDEAIIRLAQSFSPYISSEDIDEILLKTIRKTMKTVEMEKKISFLFELILEALKETFTASAASEGVKLGGGSKR